MTTLRTQGMTPPPGGKLGEAALSAAVAPADRKCTHAAASPFGAMLGAACVAAQHLPRLATAHASAPDYVARALAQVLEREQIGLERGLTALASIAASAPFVGLFGTVVGIYRALINIGTSGNASLDTIALPVGEALVRRRWVSRSRFAPTGAYHNLLRTSVAL